MKKIKWYFKLRYKLVLFYILMCLIPIALLGLYLTVTVSRNNIGQSIRIYSQSTQQLRQSLVNELLSYYSIGYDIAYDKNVIQYLDEYTADDLQLYNLYMSYIRELLNKARYRANNVQIRIYTPNTNLKISGIFIRDSKLYEERLQAVQSCNALILWNGLTKVGRKNYLSFLMPITDYAYTKEPLGVLEILIELSDLQSFIPNDKQNNNIIFVLDDNCRTIISNVTTGGDNTFLTETGNEQTVEYGGSKYLLTRELIDNDKMNLHGWSICNLIPLDYVYQNKHDIQRANLIVIVLCMLISMPLLFWFSRHTTKRVEFLIDCMNDIRKGQYRVSVIVSGNDEIAQMSRHFDAMLKKLDRLMHQVFEAQLKEQRLENAQKEAQLLALQEQINPHYLFNTMETIRMNLLLKGDQETSEIVRIFADSFRVMIDSESYTISLYEEIAFIKKYFLIHKYRYEDKIDLFVDIQNDMPDYRIPKFLLQPLIENAVYHGLELKEGNGTICLSVSRGKNLDIVVEDNGIGMTEDELYNLRQSIRSDSKDGHNYALRNIFKRLKLLYGTKAEFAIDSIFNKGTVVRLSIPLESLEEELLNVQGIDSGR